jgi:predicted Zn-dependent protease with MMP-like domain
MPDNPPNLTDLTQLAADVVGAAQRRLPKELRTIARGVPVLYEAVPAADVLAEGFEPDILGLFTGSAHGMELAHDNPAPPHILLYLQNLWDFAEGDTEAFRDEVRLTYLHELGHYFGWDEDELAARGLD